MREGLYESVIAAALEAEILAAANLEAQTANVDEDIEVHVLTQLLAEAVSQRLGQEQDRDGRLRIANGILRLIDSDVGSIEAPTRELMAMSRAAGPGVPGRYQAPSEDAAQRRRAHDECSRRADARERAEG